MFPMTSENSRSMFTTAMIKHKCTGIKRDGDVQRTILQLNNMIGKKNMVGFSRKFDQQQQKRTELR